MSSGKAQREETAEALKGSEASYRALIDELPELICRSLPDLTRTYVNESYCRYFGKSRDELLGRDFLDFLPEEDRGPLREQLVSLIPENPVGTFEHRVWRHDGLVRWQQWTNRAVFDEEGKHLGYQAVGRDFDAKKMAEDALKGSEERFRSLADASFEGICISEDNTILEANLAFADMFGYLPSEVTGMSVMEFHVPAAREAARHGMESGSEGPWYSTGLRKDGTAFDLEVRGKSAPRGGRAVRVAAMRDVTERRRVEEALKESEETHRLQARELSLLHQVRTALVREIYPPAVFRMVVEAVAETYGYVLVSAYLLEEGYLVLQHQVGYRSVLERIPLSRGVMARVARTGKPVLLEDAHADPEFLDAIQGVVSEVCVPLFDGEEVAGTLNVESTGGATLAEEDLRLMEAVGEQASVALGRARLHARAREAEQRYRALVENVPAVVYVDDVDEANHALYRSPFVLDVLGYEPEEFLSDPLFWQSLLHPHDRERVLAENARTNESGEPFRIEYRMIRKDGQAVWIRDEAVLIRDEDGHPKFWQGYFVDVTDRKLAEERLREAEERYRTIVEEVPAVTYVHTQRPGAPSITSYISPQIETVLGYAPEEYSSDPEFWKTILHPEDRERVVAEDLRTGETGEPFKLEYRMVRKDGGVVWLREEGRLVRRERGTETWHGVMFDISEIKRAELALKESEERYRKLVELSPEPIAVHDGKRLLFINQAGALLFGAASPDELLGREVLTFVHPDHREVVASRVRHTLTTGERSPLLEEKYLTLDGGVLDLEVTGQPVTFSGKRAVQAVLRDVTERKALEEDLARRANHDPLTGLPNRDLFKERLRRALVGARRLGGRVAVLFMDLDNFKVVNDSLGHEVGDRLLVAVAERLKRSMRPGDTVARLGGDEFVVLLEEAVAGVAEKAARRISRILEGPFALGGGAETFVTVSLGIAESDSDDKAAGDILREADMAMYRAKRSGKASHAVFEPSMATEAAARHSLENDLRKAIERGQLRLHYQPLVRIESGEVLGAEALLRWKHPERGLLRPKDFLRVAEETGLIVPVGRWVLREACRQVGPLSEAAAATAPGNDAPARLFRINVNVSLRQLREAGFATDVARTVEEAGIRPGSLTLELTEGDLVEEAGADLGVLRELKAAGIALAIDDFGTGYSSLSYLGRLPVDQLKLDGSIVAGVEQNRANAAIVSATVTLAGSLGLGLVAEGVETEGERLKLLALGCAVGQGTLWRSPGPTGVPAPGGR